jgi:ubiquinone/menaquinone biosynthesis C-methylase UbiE
MAPALIAAGERFLSLAGAGILDVGVGYGRNMLWLEKQGASVVGFDLSQGMLREASIRVRGPLVQGDMRHLPFGDEQFGGVWCMGSLYHLPTTEAPPTLRELRRVLASGGALFLGLREGDGETWEPCPYGYQDADRFIALYRPDEAKALLEAAGLVIVEQDAHATTAQQWLTYVAVRPATT